MSLESFSLFHHSVFIGSIVSLSLYNAEVGKHSCELNTIYVLTTTEYMPRIWYQYDAFKPSSGLSGGSVVIYALFTVVPIVCV